MKDQQADLAWRAKDVPVSTRFDDPYFSLENGLEETRFVFLQGNGLPDRFRDGFHIAELGFGTGLNVLAATQSWLDSGQTGILHITSFERFPMAPAEMRRALAGFESLRPLADPLIAQLERGPHAQLGPVSLTLILGDARQTVPDWPGRADAWFLDGFAPAKNPELWDPDLLTSVARHTVAGGTAATYTAAGAVRRALQAAGFAVTRTPGFGRKRHMTRAVLP